MKAQLTPIKEEEPDRTVTIFLTAAQIFHERGYDATSMSDLAEALEITKAGLYYYIDSKEDLLFRIMNFGLDWLEKEVIEPARALSDPEERLRWVIRRHGSELLVGSRTIPILTDEDSALAPKHRMHIQTRKRLYFDLVRDTLNDLKRQGKLRDIDTTVAAFSLFGMLLWLPRWYQPDGSLAAAETLDHLTNLFFGGLLNRAATSE